MRADIQKKYHEHSLFRSQIILFAALMIIVGVLAVNHSILFSGSFIFEKHFKQLILFNPPALGTVAFLIKESDVSKKFGTKYEEMNVPFSPHNSWDFGADSETDRYKSVPPSFAKKNHSSHDV